jgi:argininosuccinate synthase
LKENHDCEIIAVCADLGQTTDWKAITKRALASGAAACHVVDVKKEYVEEYIWPALKANAVYEDKYLLGTSTARPLIAKVLVEYARKEKAAAIAHGATSKGNDQLRFDLGIIALAPDLEIIAPWRIWKIKSREEAMRYLAKRKLPLPENRKKSYSIDDNLWHISHEGLELEDPANEPKFKKILSRTITPEKAPNKAEYVEIEFEKGIPIALNGKKMEGSALINQLNKIGGANGIGIADLIENRIIGMKVRGVYETPGGSILYYAHQELERLCLDRHTYLFKKQVSLKLSELIYSGFWFTPLREALCAFVDSTQQTVTGKVKLKLYKGSISSAGATSPNSLYNSSFASLTTGEIYTHADAKGFVKLYGLPVLARSLMELEKKGGKLPAASASANGKTKTAGKKTASGKAEGKPQAAGRKEKPASGKGRGRPAKK